MEKLRIKAGEIELKVTGGNSTLKEASKEFYGFLSTKAGNEILKKETHSQKVEVTEEETKKKEEDDCLLCITKEIPKTLEELMEQLKSGELVLHTGDEINCRLKDGEEVTFVVTDTNEEYIRFESKDCVGGTEICWSESGNTNCGLLASNVMKYLNEEIWNLLPDELQREIEPVVRKHKDADGNVKEYRTCLFLPAASEVFDEDSCYGDQGLYKQLEYYKDRRNRMRGAKKGEDTKPYWLASVRSGYSTSACFVDYNGGANYWYASSANRVPVCFVLRNHKIL